MLVSVTRIPQAGWCCWVTWGRRSSTASGKRMCPPEESTAPKGSSISTWFTPTHLRYLRTAALWHPEIILSCLAYKVVLFPILVLVHSCPSFQFLPGRFWAKPRHFCLYCARSINRTPRNPLCRSRKSSGIPIFACNSAPPCAQVPAPRDLFQTGLFDKPDMWRERSSRQNSSHGGQLL